MKISVISVIKYHLDNKHKKGFINHLRAIQWLTENDYIVFNNLSSLGDCDIVAMNTDGETLKIDIKTVSKRKNKSVIYRSPTKEQKKKNICLLMVYDDGKCELIQQPNKRGRTPLLNDK